MLKFQIANESIQEQFNFFYGVLERIEEGLAFDVWYNIDHVWYNDINDIEELSVCSTTSSIDKLMIGY